MAASLSPNLADQCRRDDIPVIFFCRRPRQQKACLSVMGSNREGSRQIAKHLIQQGYRNLGFLAGPPESPTSRERESAFTAHVKTQGLAPPVRAVGTYHRDGALRAARELLSRQVRPDAVFCANDYDNDRRCA